MNTILVKLPGITSIKLGQNTDIKVSRANMDVRQITQKTIVRLTGYPVKQTSAVIWGSITGILSNQTDLNNRLLDINGGTF